jgi:monoterpene epsilon-lactone hydrolase
MTMARINHSEHLADRAVMLATRAYLALQPQLAMRPDARPAYDAFIGAVPAADGVSFEEAHVGGVRGWWCRPEASRSDVAVLHLHGGAYVLGSAGAYRNFVSHLAAAAGAAAFVADYALAPERPFPAAHEDVLAVLRGLRASGVERIAMSGDSAGAGLALAMVQSIIGDDCTDLPHVAGVVALSPWTDLTLTSASLTERASFDPVLSREQLADAARLYAGTKVDLGDPRLSSRFGCLAGMPPVMIHVGSDEVLLDDALAYEEAAEVHVWAGMTHVFPASIQTLRAAREAIDFTGGFLRATLEDRA